MSLLDSLAEALGKEPEQVASEFGLASVEDEFVARALEARVAGPAPPVSAAIANELGLPADADETQVRAALIGLRAPSVCLDALRTKLALEPNAPEVEILNAVDGLR